MPFTFQKRLHDIIALYGRHLSGSARDALGSLPPGWIEPVRSMFDGVEQILDEAEFGTFRWTAFDKKRGSLLVSWSGARDSEVLIDQIVEAAADQTARRCVECGSSTIVGLSDLDGPRCLFHAALRSGRDHAKAWELSVIDLVNMFRGEWEGIRTISPKTVAAALPMLIQEAATYYRSPDQDARTISQQIREAFEGLDEYLRTFENSDAIPTDC